MTKTVLVDARVYVAGYDISGQSNSVTLEISRARLDATTFTDETTRITKLGLRTVRISGRGFFEAGAEAGNVPKKVDDLLFGNLAVADVPITVVPSIGAGFGGVAFSVQSVQGSYTPGPGQHGGLIPFEFAVEASAAKLIRGRILHTGNIAVGADGTALQLGAAAAGQKLYAVMHVYGFDGTTPTLDVDIESDSQEDFLGTPETQDSFAQRAGFGSEWLEVAGPVTDTWYRVVKTIGGSGGPEFDAIVLAAIS